MTPSWAKIGKARAMAGTAVLVVFVGWSMLAFRANATAREAIRGDADVSVRIAAGAWTFEPANPTAGTASLPFFPGGLVDPAAYAPLMRTVAENGHRALIVPLPRRGAFGGLARADRNRHKLPATTSRVVIAGGDHSQFGDYGFQPGDRFAAMPRQEQRRRAARVLLDALEDADRSRASSTNVKEHRR